MAGSGTTLVAAIKSNRKAYGFEIDKEYFQKASEFIEREKEIKKFGYPKSEMENDKNYLFSVGI